ncbi:MAG: hypothetical protein Q7R47_02035 [Candidatus Diapherotrites archaeon]|nr:hypothetical protein [Candidatus Diapherotrites archaeon]
MASKQTFKVVEFVLGKKEFTQYGAKKELKLAMGTVNNCFAYLLEKGFIQKKGKKYALVDPVGLTDAVSFFRTMKDLLLFEHGSSYDKNGLEKMLPKNAVFCLESALQQYSNYYTTNVVSVYLPKKEADQLKKKMGLGFGTKTILKVYEPKPSISSKVKKNGKSYTTAIRTIIDLACDKKGAMADSLIAHIWGKK